jgi:hypothetical protein
MQNAFWFIEPKYILNWLLLVLSFFQLLQNPFVYCQFNYLFCINVRSPIVKEVIELYLKWNFPSPVRMVYLNLRLTYFYEFLQRNIYVYRSVISLGHTINHNLCQLTYCLAWNHVAGRVLMEQMPIIWSLLFWDLCQSVSSTFEKIYVSKLVLYLL